MATLGDLQQVAGYCQGDLPYPPETSDIAVSTESGGTAAQPPLHPLP